MDPIEMKSILEGLIFSSESPVHLESLMEILPESSEEAILEGIRQIEADCSTDSRGVELVTVAGGYQFRTKGKCAQWIQRLKKTKPPKLSRSALETLAIVAYRQPVIRPTIEEIRGVDSGWVLRTLLERNLIRIVGRKDIPGRPILYETTKTFLEVFGLNALSDLPTPKEVPATPEELLRENPPTPEEEETKRDPISGE